jgi:Cu2+-exporting ATPase
MSTAQVLDRDELELLMPFSRLIGDGAAESQFQLSGLHCAACAGIIERALLELPGVEAARVNPASARLSLQWRPAQTDLHSVLARIERAGYGAAPDAAAPARELREREQRQALWRLVVAGFLMMQVMMMAAPAYFAEPGDLSPDLGRLLQWASWVLSLPVLFIAAAPFFSSAWRQLRVRRLGMDVPVVLGLLVTFAASSAALFEPGGPLGDEVYFDSLTMFISFLLVGRYLELRARHRAAAALERAGTSLPESVERVEADGSCTQLPPQRLRVGDRVRVFAGQAFPADGCIEQGSSSADEAVLNGESMPVAKQVGDEVVAGSLNLSAPLLMRVQRVGADTRQAAIERLVREAMSQKPAATALAERIAGPFLWVVLSLAAAGALLWSWLEPARAVWVAVSVLIVTCPCALSLAAPSAWLAATGALARRGLLLLRLELLERLCHIDTVVLDKTGTLSLEQIELLEHGLTPADAVASERLLRLARGLAAHSRHPLARALARGAVAADWREPRELPGLGMEARDADGRLWRLGAPAWVGGPGGVGEPDVQMAFGAPGSGGQVLWLRFGETLRPDAQIAIARLHQAGLRTLLLSGDAEMRVARLALEAGIEEHQSGASPADKLARVTLLQQQGRRVLMVGDGLNDAPVMARADASIVMAQGTMLARSSADGLLLSGRLLDIALARELALRTRRIVRQNLVWAAAYNAACIPLALLGWLPPWAAGLGMASSSLLVVINAQRLALRVEAC